MIGAKLLKNSSWSGIASLYSAGLLVITTPLYLSLFGEERFGLYILLASVVLPFQIISSGVTESAVKYLSEWLPASKFKDSASILRMTCLISCVIGVLAVASLYLISPLLVEHVFKISNDLKHDATASFRMAGWVWFATQLTTTYASYSTALQDYRALSIMEMVRSTVLYSVGLFVVQQYGTVFSFQLLQFVILVIVAAFWALRIVRRLGYLAALPKFDGSSWKLTFAFSSWQILSAITGSLTQHGDRILLGIYLGTAATGIYGIGANLSQRLVALAWSMFACFFPAMGAARAISEAEGEKIVMQSALPLYLLAGTAWGASIIFGSDFFTLWVGEEAGKPAYYVFSILMFVSILNIPSAPLSKYVLANGLTHLNFINNLITAAVSLPLTIYFIQSLGFAGAAIGLAAGMILTRLPMSFWICLRHMQSHGNAWNRMLKIYALPVAFLFSTVGSLAVRNTFFAEIGIKNPLYVVVVCICFVLLVTPPLIVLRYFHKVRLEVPRILTQRS